MNSLNFNPHYFCFCWISLCACHSIRTQFFIFTIRKSVKVHIVWLQLWENRKAVMQPVYIILTFSLPTGVRGRKDEERNWIKGNSALCLNSWVLFSRFYFSSSPLQFKTVFNPSASPLQLCWELRAKDSRSCSTFTQHLPLKGYTPLEGTPLIALFPTCPEFHLPPAPPGQGHAQHWLKAASKPPRRGRGTLTAQLPRPSVSLHFVFLTTVRDVER